MRPGERGEGAFLVLPVSGHVEDIELRVRMLVNAGRKLRGASIVLADFGADRETEEICRRLCREFGTVKLLDGNRLAERIKSSCRQSDRNV